MTGRLRAGLGVAVAVAAGLGGYFAAVGLDAADKLASVIGVFVGLAGLGMTVWGVVAARRPAGDEPGGRAVTIEGGNSGIVSTGDGANNTQSR